MNIDADIAREATESLHAQLPLSAENIRIAVQDGVITLEGTVHWAYQKERAENAMRCVHHVSGVINAIEIAPRTSAEEIRRRIEQAFRHSAAIDAERIEVEMHDGTVILKGTVYSWHERTQAERAAWSTPGVQHVEDRIVVRP